MISSGRNNISRYCLIPAIMFAVSGMFSSVFADGSTLSSSRQLGFSAGGIAGIHSHLTAFSLNAPVDDQPATLSFSDPDRFLSKQPQQAFIRSLALPGWGQRWGERPIRGAIYTGIEAALWGGLLYFRESHYSRTGHYEAFAREHAGITGDQAHQFYVNIGNYDNSDEFNSARRSMRDYDSQYSSDAQWWSWDSIENRRTFKDLRINADRDGNRMYYVIGGLAFNRIISAIDAARGLAKKQKKLGALSNITIGFDQTAQTPTVGLSYMIDK